MTEIPTSGEVLSWARQFRELSEAEAAERLDIPVERLQAMERGEEFPNKTLFDKMAAKYRLPHATLFLRSKPKEPKGLPDFRSLDGIPSTKHTFDFSVMLSNVRALANKADRIAEEDEEFVAPELPRISLDDDPAIEGERERRRLGISVQAQLGWSSAQIAYAKWRTHLERRGVLVFQQWFPLEEGRGFSLFDSPNTPVAVVNKDETAETAKSFTIWHEYAHLLLRRPGISDEGNSSVEAFCNRFAAAFLIPTEALRELIPVWPNEPVEWTGAQISQWAGRLKVSRYALALRLEEMGLAPEDYSKPYRYVGAKVKRPRKPSDRGPDPTVVKMSELGGGYLGRALSAYDRNAIDEVQFVQAIGMNAEKIADVRDYMHRSNERVSGE